MNECLRVPLNQFRHKKMNRIQAVKVIIYGNAKQFKELLSKYETEKVTGIQ